MYLLTIDGSVISGPMTLLEIVKRFGPVHQLERAGYRLLPIK